MLMEGGMQALTEPSVPAWAYAHQAPAAGFVRWIRAKQRLLGLTSLG